MHCFTLPPLLPTQLPRERMLTLFSTTHDYLAIFMFGPTLYLFILAISPQYDFVTDLAKDFIAITQLNRILHWMWHLNRQSWCKVCFSNFQMWINRSWHKVRAHQNPDTTFAISKLLISILTKWKVINWTASKERLMAYTKFSASQSI